MTRSVEFENIEAYLVKIERSLDEIDKIAENKIARAGAMVSNAYTECKQVLGSMRAATAFLRDLPQIGDVPESREAHTVEMGASEPGPESPTQDDGTEA
jgi:hypothetical protein